MTKRKQVAAGAKSRETTNGVTAIGPSSKPLIFISHDSRDAKLAAAFSDLLIDASGGNLQTFRSSDRSGKTGMEYGSEWYTSIMDALKASKDVVALLTKQSLDRPWILFETGVAKGRDDESVAFGVALGIPMSAATNGPFAQFQNCNNDEESVTSLVLQLIKRRLPHATPREEAVRKQVQDFQMKIAALLKEPSGDAEAETTAAKLFEEVKVLFRDLPQQVEKKLVEMRPEMPRRWRRTKWHPGTLEGLLHTRLGKSSDATVWLLFISTLRDDAPWLYELGMDIYRALRAGETKKLAEARREFVNVARLTRHGHPMMRELFNVDDEDRFMAMRHLPMMAEEFLDRLRLGTSKDDGENAEAPTTGTSEKK